MPTTDWMVDEIKKVYPDSQVEVTDLNNTGDHFHARVIDAGFEGMRPLQRQRPILNHFKPHIAANLVHALDLKCMTPQQAEAQGESVFHPHQGEMEFFGVHVRRPDKE